MYKSDEVCVKIEQRKDCILDYTRINLFLIKRYSYEKDDSYFH